MSDEHAEVHGVSFGALKATVEGMISRLMEDREESKEFRGDMRHAVTGLDTRVGAVERTIGDIAPVVKNLNAKDQKKEAISGFVTWIAVTGGGLASTIGTVIYYYLKAQSGG